MFYWFRLLCLFIFIPFASMADFGLKIDPLACPQDKNLSVWCAQQLTTKQNKLHEELLNLLELRKADWERKKDLFEAKYEQICLQNGESDVSGLALPPEISGPAYELLTDRKIKKILGIVTIDKNPDGTEITALKSDGKQIKILCGNSSIEADAATDQMHILVNPDIMLQTHATPAEIKATIGHELIHILYSDPFDLFCLTQLYRIQRKKIRISKKKFAKKLAAWERVQEMRADILSGLFDKELAQAHKQHFLRNMPKRRKKLKRTSVHPTTSQRYAYMDQLVQAICAKNLPDKSKSFIWLAIFGLLVILLLGLAYKFVRGKNDKN